MKRKFTDPPATVELLDAKMVSPTELGMGVDVTFPANMPSGAPRNITFYATINGKQVVKTVDVTGDTSPGVLWGKIGNKRNQMYDLRGNLLPTTPLKINLSTEGVPRFTDNVRFTMTAIASYQGGTPSDPSSRDVTVLLPVVVIEGCSVGLQNEPGYQSWAYAFFYKNFSDALKKHGYLSSTHYGTSTQLAYRTLWDPSDPVVQYNDVRDVTVAQLQQMMDNVLQQVRLHSYANKMNLVGKSFGGLIARDYAAENPSGVNTVIAIGTPHMGTVVFYSLVLKDYPSMKAALQAIPKDRAAYWTVPTYANALQFENGNQAPNLFTNPLADVGKATGVTYYCIYSDYNANTPESLTVKSSNGWYAVVNTQTGQGDGYIAAISAGNRNFGTPIRLVQGGDHAVQLNQIEVQNIIENIVMKGA